MSKHTSTGSTTERMVYRGRAIDVNDLHRVLMSHPDVVDATIVGDPLDEVESQPIAFVTIDRGSAATGEQILEFVALRVSPGQRLRGIYVTRLSRIAGAAVPVGPAIGRGTWR